MIPTRHETFGWWMAIALSALSMLSARLVQAQAGSIAPYWEKFPHPKTVYVTGDIEKLPSLAAGKDRGGVNGALMYSLSSLSGLAALAVREGQGDSMIWLNQPANESYAMWLDEILKRTGAKRVDVADARELIRQYARADVVKGYIVYRADASHRQLYVADPQSMSGYNGSINVATSLAPLLGGIVIEESGETAMQELGLKRLADVRDRDEGWLFEMYRDRLNRSLLCMLEPKIPNCRDYAVATRSLCLYGNVDLAEKALAWVKPNAPIVGWDAGEECKIVAQANRHAKFHTATNWCVNMPLLSVLRAGEDYSWAELGLNERSRVDPLTLEWRQNAHYTSFVITDGDNVQWYAGQFFGNEPNFWQSPSRATFPMGWTAPPVCLSQMAAPVLAYMARTASANDPAIMMGAGLIYLEDYGVKLEDPDKALEERADQIAETMDRLGVRILHLINYDWKSERALKGYSIFARRIPHLEGILAIQYAPYTAGAGEILWTTNKEGETIPIISARYGIWEHHSQYFKNEGPPALVADCINKAAHQGPITSDAFIDWTTVHVWSYFRKADASQDLLAEDIDQKLAGEPGVARCVEPVRWCIDRLGPQVNVVTPEELIWRARLHLKTRETLDALAARIEHDEGEFAAITQKVREYRGRLAQRPPNTDRENRLAFEELQRIRLGK